MPILLLIAALAISVPGAFAQSPTPTPSDRPTLNRRGEAPPSPNPAASPSPAQPAQSSPAPTSEAERSDTPAKPSYPDLLHRFDHDSRSPLELRDTNFEKRGNVMLIELN